MAKKQSYKVVGLAKNKNESDIEVLVKAENPESAITEASKKMPALAKHGDVRVYARVTQLVRVH